MNEERITESPSVVSFAYPLGAKIGRPPVALAKEATEFLSIPPLPAFSPLCIK